MSGGLIANGGKKTMLDRTYNTTPTRTAFTKFKVGTGTTNPLVTDTDVDTPVPIAGTEEVDSCDATTGWTDSADMTLSVNTSVYKKGTGSLNLTKDGTGSATASTSKTTTSINFTSKEFSIWIYVADATVYAQLATTGCIVLRYGSDSSNYYQWNIDKSEITSGDWTLLDGLTSANADSTTGTPSLSAMDYTYVAVVAIGAAQTWVAGKIVMDDIKVISTDDYSKLFESGYPTFDYTAIQTTMRCRLSVTEAVGYGLTNVGVINTDATPELEGRDEFNVFSKGQDDEIIFVIKSEVE